MTRQQALTMLSDHKGEMLLRFGVRELMLFGSTARDAAGEASDVDILVTFEGPTTADGFFGVWEYLEQLLGVKVDLATRTMIKPWLWRSIEKDLLHVS